MLTIGKRKFVQTPLISRFPILYRVTTAVMATTLALGLEDEEIL